MLSKSKVRKFNLKNNQPIPRFYQQEAVDKVCEYLNDNNSRTQLILPCASGKTLISLWIMEKLGSKLTLYLVPSLQLLKQVKDEYRKNSSMLFDYTCVCSAKDIDDEFTTIGNIYEEIDKI